MTKKLIEVALPLEAISTASRRDKDRKTGTIKNVHKWFAPMPMPAWRALLFASLVSDPDDPTMRARLLSLTERLVPADGAPPDAEVVEEARAVIREEWGDAPPVVFDPFCGGGSTLIEAQRLGLSTAGCDLNPVPVLVTRVLTELIPAVAARPPLLSDEDRLSSAVGHPLEGLVSDVKYYAERVRQNAWTRVGHLYPEGPEGETVKAWLWARTVVCPNPACGLTTPLVSSFWLTKRKTDPTWIEPLVSRESREIRFKTASGARGPRERTIGRAGARCVSCDEPISLDHIRAQGRAGQLGTQLLGMAAERDGKRVYLSPTKQHEDAARVDEPRDIPDLTLPAQALGFRIQAYGFDRFVDLFAPRQLHALAAFADAASQVSGWVLADGGDQEYARAIASVVGLCVGKLAQSNSTQVRWYIDSRNGAGQPLPAFGRNALPMVWDFAEANPFGGSVGDWMGQVDSVSRGLHALPSNAVPSTVFQLDARHAAQVVSSGALVATDPPYFAQIGYADLSDYFYIWLRRALKDVHPDIFATLGTPKDAELIASAGRHGGNVNEARQHFVDGFTSTFKALGSVSVRDTPMLVVYGHRQEESTGDGLKSTAWDSMLAAIITAGLSIVGTWPIRGTHSSRQRSQASNALASYIVLVCRPRPADALAISRKEFVASLKNDLPGALRALQDGNIAPVDLAQAAIGPGMGVFSRYARVIEADGSIMPVGMALGLINQVLDEIVAEQEADFDPDTRWAVAWFDQYGMSDGPYGVAETLSKAKNTAVSGLVDAGILSSKGGNVRLLTRDELADGWDPARDVRLTVWEVAHHMIRRLETHGEASAAELLQRSGGLAEPARELAYRLYLICERRRLAREAFSYNSLVVAWPEINRLATTSVHTTAQAQLEV